MNWEQLLDDVEEMLIPEVGKDKASTLCSRADSHEPWLSESHKKDFVENDVIRLYAWLYERRGHSDFKCLE